jgi:hypothetical protein
MDDNNDNPIIIWPHIVFTDRRQRQVTQYVVVLWLACRCLLSVNTICGRIMIGLSLSSVSKHNMWSYYDWVVVVFRLIMQPHIVFTDGRQRQPNHNTTTYCVYLQTTINPIIIRPHIVFTDERQRLNTICGRIMIGLSLLSFVNKHNMWSYYDWVVVVFFRQ